MAVHRILTLPYPRLPQHMKILCSGDLHIGRSPSRIPSDLDSRALSCGECWNALVEAAIAEDVDLVALSGDVVDEANKFYEATGALERGIRRLSAAGIQVLAVAGNHDHDVLPRLFKDLSLDGARLLGAGGQWERYTVQEDGRDVLHVDGWSFPSSSYREDPLHDYALEDSGSVPVLGLLHSDLDQPGSPYAPVRLSDLRSLPLTFWLLGHVHGPMRHSESILYPGSPQSMDPGEVGWHGAWLLEMDAHGVTGVHPLPLSRVRYETIEVNVEDAADEMVVDSRVAEAVRRELRQLVENDCGPLQFVSFRVRLVGRTSLHRRLAERATDFANATRISHGGVTAFIDRMRVATQPALDLATLASGADAPGTLARLVIALEGDKLNADHERLLRGAEQRVREVARARSFAGLPDAGEAADRLISAGEARTMLKEQSYLLLDELLANKTSA